MRTTDTNVETMLQLFSMIRKAYAKQCYKGLKQYNFSPNEIDVLIFLSSNKTIDTAKELALLLNISKALVCRSVDSLIQRGLIETRQDIQDKRIHHLTLKEESENVIACIQKEKENFAQAIRADIEVQDMRQMIETMKHIHKNVVRMSEGDELI